MKAVDSDEVDVEKIDQALNQVKKLPTITRSKSFDLLEDIAHKATNKKNIVANSSWSSLHSTIAHKEDEQ